LYGLPGTLGLAGRIVQVGLDHGSVTIFSQGQVVAQHAARALSGTLVLHPDQFHSVPPARTRQQSDAPLGHQLPPPTTIRRSLDEYDQLCGLSSLEVVA
jgi:hypothetical protein